MAGLIEGDGSIYVSDNIRNKKGILNQANIEIVFTKYDLNLAKALIKQIGGVYIKTNDNYLRLFFYEFLYAKFILLT